MYGDRPAGFLDQFRDNKNGNIYHKQCRRNGSGVYMSHKLCDTGGSGSYAGRRRHMVESAAQAVFTVCAFCSVAAVMMITLYMTANGLPAFFRLGIREILFGKEWKPTADTPSFGIFYIVLASVVGTVAAVVISVPIAVLTAVFLAEIAPKGPARVVRAAVELLAGIPSVIYGLLGLMILNPLMYRAEQRIFRGSEKHQFTGGANLLTAVLVLAVMILPTVIHISETAVRSVPEQLKASSLALGASRIQTIFRVILPAARPGIVTAVVLGVGRALGEAMAVGLVSGGRVNVPLPFSSVRFLTTAIVSEMGYAGGLHRQVLFTIGLVLFGFIMAVNTVIGGMFAQNNGQEE